MLFRPLAGVVALFALSSTQEVRAQSLWPWQLESKLVAPDADANDRAGAAIAAQGTLMLVGAPNDDEAGVDAGAVYAYHEVAGSWVLDGKLLSAVPRPGGHFGYSISLDGDLALIGSPSIVGGVPGDAYVYRAVGSTWSFEARLQSSQASQFFGRVVAISRDVAVVKDPYNVSPKSLVFERAGATWTATISIPSASHTGVAVDGDTLVDGGGSVMNAYHRSGFGAWQFAEMISPSLGSTYGLSIELHDGKCAISGRTGQLSAWFVDVFDFDASTSTGFVESGHLSSSAQLPLVKNAFGASLAFARDDAHDADLLVVGAPRFDFQAKNDGVAQVFARFAKDWVRVAELTAPDGAASAEFGSDVGLTGTHVVVGAWQADSPAADSGATYSYSLVPVPTVYCSAKPNSLGCLPQVSGVGSPSVSAGSGFQVGCVDVLPNKLGVLFYSRKSALLPFRGGWLCVEPPLKRAAVQTSDGIDFCTGAYSVDLNVYLASGHDPALVPGATVVCQWATRDPQDAWQSGLSDALWFELGP